jgi:thioredoxin 1
LKELNKDNFETEVVESREPVLVDFWGPQCKPCLVLLPALEKIERDYAGRLKITKVNAVENRMLCAKLRVMSLPTFLLYKDGVEAKRLVGEELTKSQLVEAIEGVIA